MEQYQVLPFKGHGLKDAWKVQRGKEPYVALYFGVDPITGHDAKTKADNHAKHLNADPNAVGNGGSGPPDGPP
jgi:hypothetical protein